jgi:hypothetical protein
MRNLTFEDLKPGGLSSYLDEAAIEVERIAIELYQQDSMMILAYERVQDSWNNDREAVRQRYREAARLKMGWNSSV